MSDLQPQFTAFKDRFNPEAAADVDEVFQFDVDGTQFWINVTHGTCDMGEGEHDDPSVTLRMNKDTMKGLLTGDTNGMQAFLAGQLKVEGNMMLATQLSNLFSR